MIKLSTAICCALCLMAAPSFSQETAPEAEAEAETPELRPAPDYFVETIVALTIAQQVARSCKTLSVNPVEAQKASASVMERLAADGFNVDAPHEEMIDPSERAVEMQQAFLAKHSLVEGIGEEDVCAAGRAEMAEGSETGSYLIEVDG